MSVLGRPRIYKDLHTTWRENKRRQRKAKKPYYTKRAEALQRLEDISALEAKEAQGVYDVVVIDPPWPVHFGARELYPNQASLPYPTMSLEAIMRLRLPMAEACHVWLWTTQRFVPEAFHCLEAWGLRYVCAFVWRKPGGMQPMHLPQFNCELALYASKGTPLFVDTTAFPTCFDAPRQAHSEKPAEFYAMVRRVTAGRRLDMFARRVIPGFDGWGYEAPGPQVLAQAQPAQAEVAD
jgi:N6-adenosine-specific RNA methylase IME4